MSTSLTALANAAASDAGVSKVGGFSIMELGPIVLDGGTMENAYCKALVNKINNQIIHDKMYKNSLAMFKHDSNPLGAISEQIFVNPTAPENYDMNAVDVFAVKNPDIKTVYYSQNSQKQYRVTIYRHQLKQAFTSEANFSQLVNSIINQLYSSANIYEFEKTKYLLNSAINVKSGGVPTAKIRKFGTISAANAKNFLAECRALSLNMSYPSSDYNNWVEYAENYNGKGSVTTVNEEPVVTWTTLDNQYIIIRADVLATVDVEALASAFNIDKANFMGHVVPVNNFSEKETDKYKINAIVCDRSFFNISDDNEEASDMFNPKALSHNYFLTKFQTFGTVPFANAVAFVEDNPIYTGGD